ncbi:hypothetical protein MJO28_006099 [Puccinia striiformis f. sp. tritici]|uniref:Uncharacterized protein n=1 Tax=Puccinia striiformis f. sp. tritici TaxID=168172 RepID=A0ACC0EFZ1_9BASI|nr:hypothetical protein MJO28_006099 [Puccinia striiformis f. sp. tritici]
MENDISPVPMVKIEPQDEEFGFDGTNVNQFLDSYRKAAQATGASEDDMAQQLGFFVLGDDLLNIVETLNGYEPPDWPRLKASMIMYWVSNETPIHPVVDYQAPTKNSPLLESPPTVFSDIIATPSVPESQEEEVNAEPEPSEQTIEDPAEAAVSLLPPMPSPIRGSSNQSEVCLENNVENDHLNASDSGQHEFPNLQLPDISAFELLKMEPLVKEEKTTLVSLHQVKKNWEDSTVPFGHLVNAVEHNPVPSAPTMLQIDLLPEGLGEDHNYFIDRFHPSDHTFNTEPSISDMTSTPDQVTGVFSDSHLPSAQNSDSEKGLHITRTSNMISLPLSHRAFQPNLILSSGEPLRDGNQLPSFAFEEKDTSFSNNSIVFKCENNQDPLFQDSLQGSLRDEDKLSLFQLKNTEGSTCEEKMVYLLWWKEEEDSFQEPVSPFQGQLRNEDKLYEKFGCMGEAKWRNWGTKVSPPNCASPRFDIFFSVKALSRAMYVSKTLSLSLFVCSVPPNRLPALSFNGKEDTFQESPHSKNYKDASDSPSFLAPSGEAALVFLDSLAPVDAPFSVIGSLQILSRSLSLWEAERLQETHLMKKISATQVPLASSFEFHRSFTPPVPSLAEACRDTNPVPPDRSTGYSSLAAVSLVQTISLSNPFDLPPNIRFLASISDDLTDDCHSSRPIVFDCEVVNKLNIDLASSHQATHYYLVRAFSSTPNGDKSCCNIIKILTMISNALNVITFDCSLLFSYHFNSGASLFHFSSSSKDSHGLAWKRVGVGSSHIHLPAANLRNEDKLISFQSENLALIWFTGFNSTFFKLKENLVSWKMSAAPVLASLFCWIEVGRLFLKEALQSKRFLFKIKISPQDHQAPQDSRFQFSLQD